MKKDQDLISSLPYGPSFRFVDQIESLTPESIVATYCFKKEWPVFRDHFPGQPVVPGVYLTECAAQIGLVLHGLYLLRAQGEQIEGGQMAFSEAQVEFLKPVYPDEILKVKTDLIYFRFNKIKTRISMFKGEESQVVRGYLSGMLVPQKQKNK
jgi:3-hydroxyacyl-[acyl-carrier-protein] dehydratase